MTAADGPLPIEVVQSEAAPPPAAEPDRAVFFYDLADPDCYLVAERILAELPALAEWQPVLGAGLGLPATALDAERLAQAVARHQLMDLRLAARLAAGSQPAVVGGG